MDDIKKTIAEVALSADIEKEVKEPEEVKEPVVVKPEPKPAKVEVSKKYTPGSYRADKFIRIIKKLSFEHSKDSTGKVQKTYGTWAKSENMIIFQKNAETVLTETDLKLPAIQRLIDTKVIYRMG